MASGQNPRVEMVSNKARGNLDLAPDEQDHPPHHGMSAGQYITTRFSTLRPPMNKAPNPVRLIRSITGIQWAFFMVAFFAWVSNPKQAPKPLS